MCVVIVDFIAYYIRLKPVLIATILLLSAYFGYQGFERNYSSTIYYNGVYEEYKVVKTIVIEDAEKRGMLDSDIAVLARDTWDVYEGTGFKTIMVPNNDINTILYVAAHYNAHYLMLPAERPQLDKIFTGMGPDPHFHFIGAVPNSALKLYFLDFSP